MRTRPIILGILLVLSPLANFACVSRAAAEPTRLWPAQAAPADSIQIAEIQFFGEVAGLQGDFDGDNDVDGLDFLTWQRGFGMLSGAEISDGDANNDGKVDAEDLQLWHANYGSQSAPLAGTTAVPEPTSLILGMCFLFTAVVLRRNEMSTSDYLENMEIVR